MRVPRIERDPGQKGDDSGDCCFGSLQVGHLPSSPCGEGAVRVHQGHHRRAVIHLQDTTKIQTFFLLLGENGKSVDKQ